MPDSDYWPQWPVLTDLKYHNFPFQYHVTVNFCGRFLAGNVTG